MPFTPHTQQQLKLLKVQDGKEYKIEYVNKDYFNGEETIERGIGTAVDNGGAIHFTVTDPYGMDKMIMQVRILG